MDTETFEDLLNKASYLHKEGIQKGIIVRKGNDGVLLDIGSKAEKFISRTDFSDEDWTNLNTGDEILVFMDGGKASYSKARRAAAVGAIKDNFISRTPVAIRIKKIVKGGYVGMFNGLEVFIPLSLSGKQPGGLKEGSSYNVLIKGFDEEDDKIICSVKDYEIIAKEKAFYDFSFARKAGDTVSGSVKNIIEKGVFIDVGGIDGFIPFSELTFKRIKSPGDVLAVGDNITAKIIELNEGQKKITLSLKALEQNPWDVFINRYKDGDKIEGTVRNIINQGVFVEVIDGLDGFIHLSEMSWTEHVNDPKKFFKIGDRVECVIKKIDAKDNKVSLSFKDVLSNPWREFIENNKVGDVLNATLKEIGDKGIVVNLQGGLEGFVPNEYIAWSKINEAKKQLNVSDDITVKFAEGNAQRRKLVFSIRDVSEDPWIDALRSIKAGREIEGTVTNISDNLVFVKLMPHVEGVVRKVEFLDRTKKELSVKQGDTLLFLVKEVDRDKRKILLSHRELEIKREKEAMEEFKSKNTTKLTLGDFFKKQG